MATAKSPKVVTVHQAAYGRNQNRDYTHTFKTTSEATNRALRVTVHHDTSYSEQSSGKIEVWTAEGWKPVVTLLPWEVTSAGSYGAKVEPTSFSEVEKKLVTAALAVLSA